VSADIMQALFLTETSQDGLSRRWLLQAASTCQQGGLAMGQRKRWASLAFAALMMLSAESRSEEFVNTAMSAELSAMNDRLAALERQMQMAPAGGCASNDCGCVDLPTCCDCGWYAGAGAYFVAPRWTTNPALATAQAAGGVTTTVQTDFDYDLSGAPLFWFGYRGPSCLGFEVRGWWFDDSESIALVNPGAGVAIDSAAPLGLQNLSTTAGDVLSFASSLQIDVVDVVGSYQAQLAFGTLDFQAGVRYARVDQEYLHSEVPAAGGLIDSVASNHTFEGAGPTLALRGRAAITQRLTAIADLRYSALFGDFDQQAALITNNVVTAISTHSTDDFLNIAEIELGAEYALPWRHLEFFLDGAFVAQIWEGAGNSANNEAIIVIVDPEVSDKNADLALLGFRVGGGVRF
jgi:hypothetical protein